jgi:hypothetical protein
MESNAFQIAPWRNLLENPENKKKAMSEHGEEDQHGDREEWCMLVKNGRGKVYYDYSQVLQEVVESRSLIADAVRPAEAYETK